MSAEQPDIEVPLDEIDLHGQHVDAVFILTNERIIAVHDWYRCDEYGTYKVCSGGEKFHVEQGDVEQIATARFLREVVLDE